jgi:hypothetical protein
MVIDKNNSSDALNKHDLATILEVNGKAIMIQTEVAAQYEEVLSKIDDVYEEKASIKQAVITLDNKLDNRIEVLSDNLKDNQKENVKKLEEIDKKLFKIEILFIGSILGLVAQIVQMFMKK